MRKADVLIPLGAVVIIVVGAMNTNDRRVETAIASVPASTALEQPAQAATVAPAVTVVVSDLVRCRSDAKIPLLWCRLADCESGDGDGLRPYRPTWDHDGYFDGGLQFLDSTWDMAKRHVHGARRYANAHHAPPVVQVRVAQEWLRRTSWEQWPVCSRRIGAQ